MSGVEERNMRALMATLIKQNERFSEIELQIKGLFNRVLQLSEELEQIKQERMESLVARFGSGPTSRE